MAWLASPVKAQLRCWLPLVTFRSGGLVCRTKLYGVRVITSTRRSSQSRPSHFLGFEHEGPRQYPIGNQGPDRRIDRRVRFLEEPAGREGPSEIDPPAQELEQHDG